MSQHTYQRHVPPTVADRVDALFDACEALVAAGGLYDLEGRTAMPGDLLDEVWQGVMALQAQAVGLRWRGVAPDTRHEG